MTEERKQFEAWAKMFGAQPDLTKANGGANYADPFIDIAWLAWKASRAAQPASPALKLPDGWVAVPREATSEMIESGWTYSVLEKNATAKGTWDCMVAAAPTAPHTAPIIPICATGGAEWVSNERVEEIVYRAEMFGHGAGYLPDEVIPMANELLALRKAFTQPIVWIHQTTGAKLNNSVIEDVRKQSGAWIPLYRKPNLPL